jgi:hypothetical protein
MNRIQESYKGRNIVIEEPDSERERMESEPRLFIDDQQVNLIQNSDGSYSSAGLYYTNYVSLSELARATIDTLQPEKRASDDRR